MVCLCSPGFIFFFGGGLLLDKRTTIYVASLGGRLHTVFLAGALSPPPPEFGQLHIAHNDPNMVLCAKSHTQSSRVSGRDFSVFVSPWTQTSRAAMVPNRTIPASVAVTFSGWLNVTIPDGGRDARRFLVDPLGADVFVAGTFLPTDCAAGDGGRCLLRRLRHLQPLTGVDMAPMLTRAQLTAHVHAAPAFGPVSRHFKLREMFKGLNLFAPVLGRSRCLVAACHLPRTLPRTLQCTLPRTTTYCTMYYGPRPPPRPEPWLRP